MNTQMGDALRKSLDEVDRRRKWNIGLTVVWVLLLTSVAIAGLLWAHDTRALVIYGVAFVSIMVSVSAFDVNRTSYQNTCRVLKAIEMLSQPKEH